MLRSNHNCKNIQLRVKTGKQNTLSPTTALATPAKYQAARNKGVKYTYHYNSEVHNETC